MHKDFILKNIANSVAISRKVANRVAERLGEEAKPERATKHNRVGRVDFFIEERKNDKERREREKREARKASLEKIIRAC